MKYYPNLTNTLSLSHIQYSTSNHFLTFFINDSRINISIWLLVHAFNTRQGLSMVCTKLTLVTCYSGVKITNHSPTRILPYTMGLTTFQPKNGGESSGSR